MFETINNYKFTSHFSNINTKSIERYFKSLLFFTLKTPVLNATSKSVELTTKQKSAKIIFQKSNTILFIIYIQINISQQELNNYSSIIIAATVQIYETMHNNCHNNYSTHKTQNMHNYTL
jgi:hypothetical protein